jgi:hypothetical protein
MLSTIKFGVHYAAFGGETAGRSEETGECLPDDKASLVFRSLVAESTRAGQVAPAFTPREHGVIAALAAIARRRGMRVAIDTGFEFLEEALLVAPAAAADPEWLVHKTPAGAIALRRWPGVAELVATIAEALAIIGAAEAPAGGR